MRKFYNELTNTILTEVEYKELIEREAREYFEDETQNVDGEDFETILARFYESDTDFVEVDENGEIINEW